MPSLRPEKLVSISIAGSALSLPASNSAPIQVTVGGKGYYLTSGLSTTLSGLTAGTTYAVYLVPVSGSLSLVVSANMNSVGPTGYTSWKLVGGVIADSSSTGLAIANVNGVPSTDPKAFTSTLSLFGNGVIVASQSRRGKFIKIIGTLVVGSSAPTGIFSFSLPSGLGADYSTWALGLINADSHQGVGTAHTYAAGKHFTANVIRNSTSANTFYFYGDATAFGGPSGDWTSTVPITWASPNAIEFELEVPISGWSSTPLINL